MVDHSAAAAGLFGSGSSHEASPNSLMSNPSILAAAAASAATNYQAEAARQFLQQLSASQALNPPSQVDLRESSANPAELGVWANEAIPPGTRFGPFMGKWTMEPTHQKFAWEVSFLAWIFHWAMNRVRLGGKQRYELDIIRVIGISNEGMRISHE